MQRSRADLNPFRNQAVPSGTDPQSQQLDTGNSAHRPGTFSNAGQVSMGGSNTFTDVGRDVLHFGSPIAISMHAGAPTSTSTTLLGSSSASNDPPTNGSRGSKCYPEGVGEHDSEIYARLLLPKKKGWPLWQPSPLNNLPTPYRRKGVSIGDVGVITANGEFDFFFNICLPADDPININNVPEHFEPIYHPQNPRDVNHKPRAWLPGRHLGTNSIHTTTTLQDQLIGDEAPEYGYAAAAPEGALLVTPCGGFREDLLNTAPYIAYAKRHAINWYKYINITRGRGTLNGSIYLITGVDKTEAWGNGVYSGISKGDAYNLVFRKARSSGWESIFPYVWDDPNVSTMNQGPETEYLDGNATLPQNQCIFLRGFRVALSEGLWGSIMGSVDVSTIQESSADSLLQKSSSKIVPFANSSSWLGLGNILGGRYFEFGANRDMEQKMDDLESNVITIPEVPIPSTKLHPLDIINQYLLATNPHTSVAITHDSVWLSVLDEDADVLPDPAELISRVWEKYEPNESDNTITLTLRSLDGVSGTQGDSPYTTEVGMKQELKMLKAKKREWDTKDKELERLRAVEHMNTLNRDNPSERSLVVMDGDNVAKCEEDEVKANLKMEEETARRLVEQLETELKGLRVKQQMAEEEKRLVVEERDAAKREAEHAKAELDKLQAVIGAELERDFPSLSSTHVSISIGRLIAAEVRRFKRERDHAKEEVAEVKREFLSTQESYGDLVTERDTAKQDAEDSTAQLRRMKAQALQIEQKMSVVAEERDYVKRRFEELECQFSATKANSDRETKQLVKEKDRAEREARELNIRVKTLQAKEDELGQEMRKAIEEGGKETRDARQMQVKLQQMLADEKDRREEMSKVTKEKEATKEQLAASERELLRVTSAQTELESNISRLASGLADAKREAEQANYDLKKLRAKEQEGARERVKLFAECTNAKQEAERMRAELEKLRTDEEEWEDERRRLIADKDQTKEAADRELSSAQVDLYRERSSVVTEREVSKQEAKQIEVKLKDWQSKGREWEREKSGLQMELERERNERMRCTSQLIAQKEQARQQEELLKAELKRSHAKQQATERENVLVAEERDAAQREAEHAKTELGALRTEICSLRVEKDNAKREAWEFASAEKGSAAERSRIIAERDHAKRETEKLDAELKQLQIKELEWEREMSRVIEERDKEKHDAKQLRQMLLDLELSLSSGKAALERETRELISERDYANREAERMDAELQKLQAKEHERAKRVTAELDELQKKLQRREDEMSKIRAGRDNAVKAAEQSKLELEELRARDLQGYGLPPYDDGLQATKAKLASLERQHEATKQLLATKIDEVQGMKMFTTKADKVSVGDVVDLIHSLNTEIYQAAAIIADSLQFPSAPQDQIPEHELSKATSELMEVLGRDITNALLRLKNLREANPDQEYDPAVLGHALQVAMIGFCGKVINEWAPTPEANKYLEGVYTKLQITESQAVAGHWRALARTQLSSTKNQELLTKGLVNRLVDVLAISGSSRNESQADNFQEYFDDILANITDLVTQIRTAVGESITSVDIIVYTFPPDGTFVMEYMEDMFGKAGTESVGKAVAGTTELGILLKEQKNLRPVVKAKILLSKDLPAAG